MLLLLAQIASAQTFEVDQRWLPGTLGALPPPWTAAISPGDDAVAVLDGAGRVTLVDAKTLAVRWQVPLVRGDGRVHGQLAFGPNGLAVAAGPLDEAVRVAVLDERTGTIMPLGRTPKGAKILDLAWLPDGHLRTRSRESEAGTPIDMLMERTWGERPVEREVAAWIPARRVPSARSNRVFVDVTQRSLTKSGSLVVDVRYRVWDDPWDPATARPLKDCPEWSEVVHVSDDGRLAYTMGQVRCVYDLDTAEVVAWETKQVPFWSALSPDGSHVIERLGRGGRSYGAVRDTRTGDVAFQLEGMEGATFTGDGVVLSWTAHRIEAMSLATGARDWAVLLDGEVMDVRVSPSTGVVVLAERLLDGGRLRLRMLSPAGKVLGTLDDVDGIEGFSDSGRRMIVRARSNALQVVDLTAPAVARPRTHRAGLTALVIDDACQLASGDEEGRVRWARGDTSRTWQVPGEVRDLVMADGEIVTLSAEDPIEGEDPVLWRVDRRAPDGDGPRRPPIVGQGFLGGRLTPDGSQVVLLGGLQEDMVVPAGKGRGRALPSYAGRIGQAPDPRHFVTLQNRDRFIGVPLGTAADQAHAWGFERAKPVGRYPVPMGRPERVAASADRVAVVDARGGGRVFKLDGGGAVDLAEVDGTAGVCCVAVGGPSVLVARGRGRVYVHDARSGDRVQTLDPGFSAAVSAIAVSPKGTCMAVGSEGGEVSVYKRLSP
ncbi:MAG: hypothetical protein AB8H79_19685 [Myxococcota bacterium]